MRTRTYRGWTMWWYEVAANDWSGTFAKPGRGSRKLWATEEKSLLEAMMRDIDRAEGVVGPTEVKG